MDFDDGAVQGLRFDFDAHDLSMLQLFEYPIQNAALRPTVHAGTDRVPVAKAAGQSAPFAAVLRDIENSIENLKIREIDVAPCRGKQLPIS